MPIPSLRRPMAAGFGLVVALAAASCAVQRPAPPSIPAPGPIPPIISRFGDRQSAGGQARRWPHYGIDIRAAVGTRVLAASDGAVLRVGEHPNSGKLVVVGHAGELASVYWHLSVIEVRAGQVVRRGDQLGRSGASGNATTPHLHFGVCRRPAGQCGNRLDAGWDDPERYWVGENPCFPPTAPAPPTRLTYPLPCGS